jgi:ABC1 family protein
MNLRRVTPGRNGPVEIDEVARTVTKTYLRPDHHTAIRKVEREAAYASRFFEALSHRDGVTCPRIIARDLFPPPRLVMELCAGQPLSLFLRLETLGSRTAEIANKIHDGLEIYTCLFEEPYYDFCFQNILYDGPTGTVTFLDFGIREGIDEESEDFPLEASLGNLLGRACYDMARPSCLFAPKQGYFDVLKAVLESFGGRVSSRRICTLAQGVLIRLTAAGPTLRRKYYKTAGTIISSLCFGRLSLESAALAWVDTTGAG